MYNSSSPAILQTVCVLRFDVMNQKEGKIYHDLFSYLSTWDRCGVVAAFSKGVKDMYVVPLPATSKVPEVLMHFNGPGEEIAFADDLDQKS